MPNSWDRDAHPVKMRKPKPKAMKACKNKMLGKEHVLKEIKQHIDAHELVDKNQPRPKLFPSYATVNTGKGCTEYTHGLLNSAC